MEGVAWDGGGGVGWRGWHEMEGVVQDKGRGVGWDEGGWREMEGVT